MAEAKAGTPGSDDRSVRVAYFYRIHWGSQDEFRELWLRNHLPILQAQRASGRIRNVSLYSARFHADGAGRWDFLVVIDFRDWAAVNERDADGEVARRLFPDQDRYRREEQRRFELLDGHWDVPLSEIELPGFE